jgi:adenylate cyclase
MADIFVSYARLDRPRVAPLVAALEARGWSVWWDPSMAPGQEFDREIAVELKAAAAVLVVWTSHSVESRWVRGEARDAADRGILVPVRLGSAPLPIDFRAVHTSDLDDTPDPARNPGFAGVIQAIAGLIAKQRSGAAPPPASTTAVPIAPSAPGPARVPICVLPFTNLSGDADQQAFSDGITEDIITELSRWRMLAVRSRSASFKYREAHIDVSQVARELNVRFIVSGSVRRLGERIRINAQLVDATTGSQVWGERFDRSLGEIFAVQDQVVQTIVSTLVGRVQVTDVERARRKPPASLEAYECVLKGNALPWDDPQGGAEATRLFQKATELDPGYGLAYALLASMQADAWRNDPDAATEKLDDAYRLALRAVELDDGESTCHSLLAHVCLQRRAFDLALRHMQRAVEINPNNQWNVADMALILVYAGHATEALDWIARARQIDPYFGPPWYWRQGGLTHMILHRYPEALTMFAHIPVRTWRVSALVAGCHARLGDRQSAAAALAECLVERPGLTVRAYMAKEPFRSQAEAAQLSESLRLAGLPD